MIQLLNMDCLSYMKLMQSNSIDLIITDPPYGVNFNNNLYDDKKDTVLESMPYWFEEWYRLLKEDSYLYLFVGVKTLHYWIEAGIKAGFQYKNIIATRTYNNGSITPNNSFGFQFQPIIIFSKGKGRPYNKVDFFPTSKSWFRDKRNKNPKPFTYEYSNFIESSICFSNVKRDKQNFHPNEKNAKLIQFLVEISTNKGEKVLDSFMGSGSTGIACKKSERDFIGIEIDYDMYNKAQNRINKENENI